MQNICICNNLKNANNNKIPIGDNTAVILIFARMSRYQFLLYEYEEHESKNQ